MARTCELTGRKTSTGHTRRHQRGSSGGVSGPWSRKAPAKKRTWKPNLTVVKVVSEGREQKMKLSMKAYKRIRKYGSLQGVTLATNAR